MTQHVEQDQTMLEEGIFPSRTKNSYQGILKLKKCNNYYFEFLKPLLFSGTIIVLMGTSVVTCCFLMSTVLIEFLSISHRIYPFISSPFSLLKSFLLQILVHMSMLATKIVNSNYLYN